MKCSPRCVCKGTGVIVEKLSGGPYAWYEVRECPHKNDVRPWMYQTPRRKRTAGK